MIHLLSRSPCKGIMLISINWLIQVYHRQTPRNFASTAPMNWQRPPSGAGYPCRIKKLNNNWTAANGTTLLTARPKFKCMAKSNRPNAPNALKLKDRSAETRLKTISIYINKPETRNLKQNWNWSMRRLIVYIMTV